MSKKYNLNYQNVTLPIIGIRTCERCGNDFGITSRQKNKRYCDGCKEIHKKEYKIEYLKDPEKRKCYNAKQREFHRKRYVPKRHRIKCEKCGEFFIVGAGRPPKMCIGCLSKSNKAVERARAYYRRDYSAEERIRISG